MAEQKTVPIQNELYEWVREQAKRERRTLKGQLSIIIEREVERQKREEDIAAGKTQISPDFVSHKSEA